MYSFCCRGFKVKFFQHSFSLRSLDMNDKNLEFPLWFSGLRIRPVSLEDIGLIPGLAQWVNDLALPQAAVKVKDVAWIWHCCSCGVGRQLQLRCNAQPRNFHMLQVWPKKRKRRKRNNKNFSLFINIFSHLGDHLLFILSPFFFKL